LANISKAKASPDIDDESQRITCYDWSDLCKEMIQRRNIIEHEVTNRYQQEMPVAMQILHLIILFLLHLVIHIMEMCKKTRTVS